MTLLPRLALICLPMLSALALAAPAGVDEPAWDAAQAAEAISNTLHSHLFDPAQVRTAPYQSTMGTVQALAEKQAARADFVAGFNAAWQGGPFSHVRLDVARASAAQTADYVDRLRVGGGGAVLEWRGQVAVLTVNTMMGLDTIEEIEAAFREIAAADARALIVDLRGNEGGAFAVVPLVSHVLSAPLDAGVFLSSAWYAQERPLPDKVEVQALPAWRGWSLKAFWADVEREGILRIRFEPAAPGFTGPVYVLTSRRTASAAELAADALQARGRALVLGEPSAGRLLSQKMYDIPGGLQLSLPVADYFSLHGGRIEGRGVTPDIAVPAPEAMDRALALARGGAQGAGAGPMGPGPVGSGP